LQTAKTERALNLLLLFLNFALIHYVINVLFHHIPGGIVGVLILFLEFVVADVIKVAMVNVSRSLRARGAMALSIFCLLVFVLTVR